ncbi:CoA-dependent acyltransferase [Auriscalpium vulgare]|uniref:CoA-dependent acyltransferase n=1 Tax=Auriscalpium vulgare TaxID=40419 RepID=A0ACB8R2C4_9AGAM|nr:CoA-dependent acyltransferase [Auriscalpium vulgare]
MWAGQAQLPKLPIPPLEDTLRRYLTALEGLQEEKENETTRAASYLQHSDPVVLALNPFFILENDPTPERGGQLPRAASLIVSSLGFIHDLRAGLLKPDSVRNIPLDMDQYTRLFGTARIPTHRGCSMEVSPESRHVVILRRGQFCKYHPMPRLAR